MKVYNNVYSKYILYKFDRSPVGSLAEFDATVAATHGSEDCGEAEHREWGVQRAGSQSNGCCV